LFSVYVAVAILLGLLVYFLRQSRAANVALLLFSLTFCFTCLEAYYRFFYIKSDGFGQLMKNFSARYYHLDAYGLRASHLPLSQTKDNLIVIGDSHVFGAGLKYPAERFSELLAAHYPHLHVVNLGLPGWDTKTELEQFTKYVGQSRVSIPLVILTYFFNDIEEDVSASDREADKPPHPPARETGLDRALQSVSKYSRLVEMLYYRLGYPRLVHDRIDQIQRFHKNPVIRSRHLATLERFRGLVEKRYSARLLIVVLPYLHSDPLLHETKFYQKFEKTLGDHGFDYIAMQPVFAIYGAGKLRVNRFDPHPNRFANQLIAKAIIDYLDKHPLHRNTTAQELAKFGAGLP
jgi:hypothetical protein